MKGQATIGLIAIVVIVMFEGCIDINGENKEPKEVGQPILYTESETDYGNRFESIGGGEYHVCGYYRVTGTTYNKGTATAHNAYAHIIFNDASGFKLHEHYVQFGDIGPSDEKSFSYDYDWNNPLYPKIKTQSYCDEIPK